jgi:regulator of extracellular matrix RemA (YlzA/DUF370 family)
MMISLGHGHFIESRFILAILGPDSASSKSLRRGAAEDGTLIDVTGGRHARIIISFRTGHAVLSTLSPEILKAKAMDLE